MKKPVRISLIIFTTFLGLIILLALMLPIILDPNDYRDSITRQVEQKTGRTLTLDSIELSFFPWLGIQLNNVKLSNANGFIPSQMLSLKKLNLQVKLIPLFKGEVQVGKVILESLNLTLSRNKNGTTNWDDLLNKLQQSNPDNQSTKIKVKTDTSHPPQVQPLVLPLFSIEGFHIVNAQLYLRDDRNHQSLTIQRLNLDLAALQTKTYVPLEMSFEFSADHPKATGKIELSTKLNITPSTKSLLLRDISLHEKIKSPLLPGGGLALQSHAEVVNLFIDKQLLEIKDLETSLYKTKIKSTAKITSLFDHPKYEGRVEIEKFSPRRFAKKLNINLPPTTDPKGLSSLALNLHLIGDTRFIQFKSLNLTIDDSTIKGSASVRFKKIPHLRLKLEIDDLDLDRYLPPEQKQPVKPTKNLPRQTAHVPHSKVHHQAQPTHFLSALTKFDLKGSIHVEKLKINRLRLQQVRIPLHNHHGTLTLTPIQAKLYQGTSRSELTIRANQTQPQFNLKQTLKNIQLAPMLKDLTGEAKASGLANTQAALSTSGLTPVHFKANLNGRVKFSLKDGEVKGINIPQIKRKVTAALKGESTPKDDKQTTVFSDAHGSAIITKGIITNKDLRASLAHARIAGQGDISLPENTIDYTLLVKFTSEASAQSGSRYDQMDKAALPIHIRGTLNNPTIKPDYDAALKELAKRELKTQEKKLKKRFEDEINKKLTDELEKLFKK